MEIYQPMLFVGLGGTGCRVGAELERRLREELCGPDGTRLVGKLNRPVQRFELPRCLQFVYADLSAQELLRVRREVVPGREHEAAARRTTRMISDLVPAGLSNSAAVAQSLRIHLDEDIIGWLPPKDDLKIGPLARGAGQLPTVGRAVLFETMRRNPDTASLAIKEALADINESSGDLRVISGNNRTPQTDPIVFVVFSVAGGTGGGIYYDYLHLVADIMQRGGKRAEIYPLVLMPSSFDDGQGGGRPAELNAGASLVDLFRLIDDQNAQAAPDEIDAMGVHGAVSVRYPHLGQVGISASTIQTAFLFGRPVGGVKRDDLNRSMVSLMVSLIGGSPSDSEDEGGQHQSFADTFINGAVDRHAVADAGIGRRSVTTSAVAALTTPLLEITDVISSRLLAKAVFSLLEPMGALDANREHIRDFISRAKLDMMLTAPPAGLPPDGNPVGYNAVMDAVAARGRAMAEKVASGQVGLNQRIAEEALQFDPTDAFTVLLDKVDLFRAKRVVLGHSDLPDPVDRGGFASLLESWRVQPLPPPGLAPQQPPGTDGIQKRFGTRLRLNDETVVAAMRRQDTWYAWRTRQMYNSAWNDCHRQWKRVWDTFLGQLRDISEGFIAFARAEGQQFDERSQDLYKPRVGVSYLLPAHDEGLTGFYRTVLDRLKFDYAQPLNRPHPTEGDVLNVILAAGNRKGWETAFRRGLTDGADAAVAEVRQIVREAVTDVLRPDDGTSPALVPRMKDLLLGATGRRDKNISEADVERFSQKLAELVPGGFSPDGTGELRVLFTYPAAAPDADLERLLRREVSLPADMYGEPEFRAVNESDTMVVVLNRTAMGVTEVPELRRVVKLWAEAQREQRPRDSLAWRRRLNQNTNYLLMNESDRREVLHRLLAAAWSGQLQVVAGDVKSPARVLVKIGARDAVPMALDLTPLGDLSSWATLLFAYERWILTDDVADRRSLAARLMLTLPAGVTDGAPQPPHPLFDTIVDLASGELKNIARVEEHRVLRRDPQLAMFREFWGELLDAALDKQVGGTYKSLQDLREQVGLTHGMDQ